MRTTRLDSLFRLEMGNGFDLIRMRQCTSAEKDAVNFISRTSQDLGISAVVKRVDSVAPYPSGLITVALGGSVLSAFTQPGPFYTAQNVMVLSPLREMQYYERIYYALCIQQNKKFYSAFGREANRTLHLLQVPEVVPEWASKIDMAVHLGNVSPIICDEVQLSVREWSEFRFCELFELHKGERLTMEEMAVGSTPFIASTSTNNGCRQWISAEPNHQGNTITVNYNGSVGEAFYQAEPYFASDDVNVLYPKFSMNVYSALFICTVIKASKSQYSWGRKWTLERMLNSTLKLPATDGALDCAAM